MKRIMLLLTSAVLIALYLGGGALAFNSPISPIPDDAEDQPEATFVPAVFPTAPLPDSEDRRPTKVGRTATPVGLICVAPGMSHGHMLCYGD